MTSAVDPDRDDRVEPSPVTELLLEYLQQRHGVPSVGTSAERPEPPDESRIQELWDYLGDFA